MSCLVTWSHSPSYPCQTPSRGSTWACKGSAARTRASKTAFMISPFVRSWLGENRGCQWKDSLGDYHDENDAGPSFVAHGGAQPLSRRVCGPSHHGFPSGQSAIRRCASRGAPAGTRGSIPRRGRHRRNVGQRGANARRLKLGLERMDGDGDWPLPCRARRASGVRRFRESG
jgi:hypothetical protein